MGSIRRLSAAVVVNHRKETGKDGKQVTKALPEAEMKQINELVREAMGFSKERGDTLSVANSPFAVSERTEAGLPVWKDPEIQAHAGDLLKYLLLFGIAAFIYLKVIQPSLKVMFPRPGEAGGATSPEGVAGAAGHVVIAGEEGEETVQIDQFAAKMQKARDMSQNDPKVVANIIKDWMGANG